VGAATRHQTPEWPAAPALASGWCVRALSHLKAAARPGQPVELKIYLLWQYLPRGRRPNKSPGRT
jgi:hypothetical protein